MTHGASLPDLLLGAQTYYSFQKYGPPTIDSHREERWGYNENESRYD